MALRRSPLPMLLRQLQRHATTKTTTTTAGVTDVRKHAASVLSQKIYLLSLITDADYVRPAWDPPTSTTSVPPSSSSSRSLPSSSPSSVVPAHSSSVGAHIRHSLDHYASVCEAIEGTSTLLKYDERFRETEAERMRSAAIHLCQRFAKLIQETDTGNLSAEVHVEFMGDPTSGGKYVLPSSIGREISFVAHHGVHHLASIRVIMERFGYQLSDRHIGVANATIHHHTVRPPR